MALFETILWLAVTCFVGIFWLALQKRVSSAFFNPMLFSLLSLFAILTAFSIPYERFHAHTSILDTLIEPAVVLFGYPLFRQLKMIGRYWWQLGLLCSAAVLFSLTICTLLSRAFGIEHWVIQSLVMMSTTTPIAMETSAVLGGSPALAAALVLVGGLSGCAFGITALTLARVHEERATGLAIGAFAHALGTATIARQSLTSAAYASTALILCATITAIVAPYYVPLLLSL